MYILNQCQFIFESLFCVFFRLVDVSWIIRTSAVDRLESLVSKMSNSLPTHLSFSVFVSCRCNAVLSCTNV